MNSCKILEFNGKKSFTFIKLIYVIQFTQLSSKTETKEQVGGGILLKETETQRAQISLSGSEMFLQLIHCLANVNVSYPSVLPRL